MRQLKIGSIPLPKVYLVDPGRNDEVEKCRMLGIPYIIVPEGWSDEKVIKAVLWRTLARKFPYIKWPEVLGFQCSSYTNPASDLDVCVPVEALEIQVESEWRENPGVDTCGCSSPAMEVSDDYRPTAGGLDESDKVDFDYVHTTVDNYIGDLGWYVDVEELQALRILPVFLDDIATAVKKNQANTAWIDGWNKKLQYPGGNYLGGEDAPNLIVLDTSGSIPSGVAGTMVTLIETLRNQANAALIITSGRSEWWDVNDQLPSPDKLARLIGGCNECRQFYKILRDHVLGRDWGNVIVFGDNDAPEDPRFRKDKDCWLKKRDLRSTRIDRIMAFHTFRKVMPGYGLWAADAAPKAIVEYNVDWVNSMKNSWW